MPNRKFIPLKLVILPFDVIIIILISISCFGTTIHVPQDYRSIQAAIDAAETNDEIIVSTGTYNENINFKGKNIILRSTDPGDPDIVKNTVICCEDLYTVVKFDGTELESCVLSGFTIHHPFMCEGIGIYGNGTHATIQYNTIWNNNSTWGGGLYGCDGIIQYNTISNNNSSYGGGLYECNGIIYNNIISDNTATYDGGGLDSCNGVIQNNTISSNESYFGGGLYGCEGVILNNLITNNIGGGLKRCNGTIQNNNISYNNGTGLAFCGGLIQNNTISHNSALSGGGLAYCHGTIQNNMITGNKSLRSGGGLTSCLGTIQNNIISDNCALGNGSRLSYGGGGLAGCNGTIQNNIISKNWAMNGGGLDNCDGDILNNTIWNNRAIDSGGGLNNCGGHIGNCIIWGNRGAAGSIQLDHSSTPTYSCIEDWAEGGIGNISSDPQLILPEYGEFHLNEDSPCIDAGCMIPELTADFEGDPRGYDGTSESRGDGSDFDIGADEYIGIIPVVTPTPAPCVINVPEDYPTLRKAIQASHDGCKIIVSPGTYQGFGFSGKNIIVTSTDPSSATIVANTVLVGDQDRSAVTFSGNESAFCILDGFTITNGNKANGGGIHGSANFDPGCFATIKNCVISGNIARGYNLTGYGGGIYLCHGIIQNNTIKDNIAINSGGGISKCNGVIQNNTITNNTANKGGGLYDCEGKIQYNLIQNNTADSSGGGLYYCDGTIQNNTITGNIAYCRNKPNQGGGGFYYCDGLIQNNIIAGNASYHGGGGFYECSGIFQNNMITNNNANWGGGFSSCNGIIQNNIIWKNSAIKGGGFYSHGSNVIRNNTICNNIATQVGGGFYMCYNLITNCIIWGNSPLGGGSQLDRSSTPTYSCIEDWIGGGTGNISLDPKLLSPEWGEFHLKADSPCIDAGGFISELFDDFEGDARGYNGTSEIRGDGSDFDIGADEFIGIIPTMTPIPTPCEVTVPGDHSTIQAAIVAADNGCKITISPGTYIENINFNGKNIILCSTDPNNADVVKSTAIDGNQSNTVVTFFGSESAFCIIEGFTLSNGKADCGGGINGNGCLAMIRNCIIKGNTANNYGGGIYKCHGIIQNNTIIDNISLKYGGGLSDCGGTIQGNKIMNNSADRNGGGLFQCRGTIQCNIIRSNSAICYGGGLDVCFARIQNNIITMNTAANGGGFSFCNQNNIINNTIWNNQATEKGGGLMGCSSYINNCIIWGNSALEGGAQLDYSTTPTYSCIQDWNRGGTGNISLDPKLLLPEYGEFHLQADSPCIDAGCFISGSTTDFEGEARGYNGSAEIRGDGSDFDIGADEYNGTVPVITPTPTPTPISTQDLIDYLLGRLSGIEGNLNSDSVIDAADLIWLITNWE